MANPTTDRPAQPVFSASLGFGATAKAFIDSGFSLGTMQEMKNRIVGVPFEGNNGRNCGQAPRYKATGFPHTPTASPSLRWGYSNQCLVYSGAGFVSGDAATRTIAFVFKPSWIHPPNAANTYRLQLVQVGPRQTQSTSWGVYLRSNATTGALSLGWFGANGLTGDDSPAITLVKDQWYACALSVNGTARRWQVYDYTAQALHTTVSAAPQDTTAAASVPAVGSGSDIVLAGDSWSQATNAIATFRGEMACVLLDLQYWTTTNFQSFYEDPWATVRGTYSATGTFTAPASGTVVHGEGGITLSFARPTGTGTGGTGSPSVYVQGYTDPAAAPSSGARLGSATSMNGGAGWGYTDSTVAAGATKYYRLECVDGSDTVYYPATTLVPLTGRRRAGTAIGLALCGDSRTENSVTTLEFRKLITRLLDRPVNVIDRGKSGLFAYDWNPVGLNGAITLSISGGTPTSGTFSLLQLTLGSGTNVQINNIPYNCSAALFKTILEDNSGTYSAAGGSTTRGIGGTGNVTCTGGPLPGTPIVATFDGPTSGLKAFGATPSIASSTLNAGTASVAITRRGHPAGAYAAPAVAEAVAMQTEEGIPYYLHEQTGTNDANAGTLVEFPADYGSNVSAFCTYALAQGLAGVFFTAAPLLRVGSGTSTSTVTPTAISYLQAYQAQLAALDNGGTKRYLGRGLWDWTVSQPLGTADGLHAQDVPERDSEALVWAAGIASALSSNVIPAPADVRSGTAVAGTTGTYTASGGGGGGGRLSIGL